MATASPGHDEPPLVGVGGIPDDATTTETIIVGGFREETLEQAGDEDWFRLTLTEETTVQINLTGSDHDPANALEALPDPYLRLFDSDSVLIAFNDDGGEGLNSELTITLQAGTYFIEADSFNGASAGDYRLDVVETAPPPPASPVDSLETDQPLNTDDPVLVYYAGAGDVYDDPFSSDPADVFVASGLTAWEEGQFQWIFDHVEAFTSIDFDVTTNRAAADLEVATAALDTDPSDGVLLGFFYFPLSLGYGVLNNASITGWNTNPGLAAGEPGTGSLAHGAQLFSTAVHEVGHGLGLGHTHDTGGGSEIMRGVLGSGSLGDFGMNQQVFSQMSYNTSWNDHPSGRPATFSAPGQAVTFSPLDIAALQNMYGANDSFMAGNDVYEVDTSAPVGDSTIMGQGYHAIWDTGGIDELRHVGSRDANIDLRAATLQYEAGGGGFVSYVDGVIGGRTIANGVVIENATGGSGNDVIVGNAAGNTLTGNAGDDDLDGGGGFDTAVFAGGHDRFDFDFDGTTVTVSDTLGTQGSDDLVQIEMLSFSDGAASILTIGAGGELTILSTDEADRNGWATKRQVIDANGDVTETERVNDNGFEVLEMFSGSVRTSRMFTDGADARSWTTKTEMFDTSGARIGLDYTYDNGDTEANTFRDGALVSRVLADVSGIRTWAERTNTYDNLGKLAQIDLVYDDGDLLSLFYAGNGSFWQRSWTDVSDTQNWTTRVEQYDASGLRTQTDFVYDNSDLKQVLYTAGTETTVILTDVAGDNPWATRTETLDASGNRTQLVYVFDDLDELEVNYIDGVLRQRIDTDVNDDEPWFQRIREYDETGVLSDTSFILDGA